MKIKPIKIVLYVLALLPFAAVGIFYGRLPEVIPVHWNFSFNPDVWSAKSTLWLFPVFSAVGTAALELPIFLKIREDKAARIAGEFIFAAFLLAAVCFIIYNA